MATEMFASFGKDLAIQLTPVGQGRFEVYLDGNKIWDKKEAPGKPYPSLAIIHDFQHPRAEWDDRKWGRWNLDRDRARAVGGGNRRQHGADFAGAVFWRWWHYHDRRQLLQHGNCAAADRLWLLPADFRPLEHLL